MAGSTAACTRRIGRNVARLCARCFLSRIIKAASRPRWRASARCSSAKRGTRAVSACAGARRARGRNLRNALAATGFERPHRARPSELVWGMLPQTCLLSRYQVSAVWIAFRLVSGDPMFRISRATVTAPIRNGPYDDRSVVVAPLRQCSMSQSSAVPHLMTEFQAPGAAVFCSWSSARRQPLPESARKRNA